MRTCSCSWGLLGGAIMLSRQSVKSRAIGLTALYYKSATVAVRDIYLLENTQLAVLFEAAEIGDQLRRRASRQLGPS